MRVAVVGAAVIVGSIVWITRPPLPDLAAWQPEDWSTLAAGVTAAVAVAAAVFAFFQVLEARTVREDQARPFVIVDIQPSVVWQNILNLTVENIGKTLARDVRIAFDPPLRSSMKDNDLSNSLMLTEGIPSMPPGRRVTALFDLSHDRLSAGLPLRFRAEVSCKDAHGRKQESLGYTIDLEFLYGLEQVTEYGTHQIADALRKIEKNVAKWTGRGGRLAVYTRDEDALNESERIQRAMTGKYPRLGGARPSELVMLVGRNTLVRLVWQWLRERLSTFASMLRGPGRRLGVARRRGSGSGGAGAT